MSPKQVKVRCEEIISKAGTRRLWLSTGGGMSPGTPFRNIDAMVAIAKKYEKK
jgi:uroporphyrinogen-III decarboxylase